MVTIAEAIVTNTSRYSLVTQLQKPECWVTLPFGNAYSQREGYAYVPQPNLQR